MAAFHDVWTFRASVLDELDTMCREAEEIRPKESHAALSIQRVFRGQSCRRVLNTKRLAQIHIGRVYRGHLGRLDAMRQAQVEQATHALAFFHYNAMQIQKSMRGYLSRTYKHDFIARKRYISEIDQRGQALRTLMHAQYQQQQQDVKDMEKRKRAEDFVALSRGLHHLIGTKTTPGIYSSPFPPIQPPTAFGVPVEQHICENSRAYLRSMPRLHAPVKPRERTSLRAQSSFRGEHEQQQQEKRLNVMKRVSLRDFNTSCKAHLPAPPYLGNLNTGVPFTEQYRNPYCKRGVPLSKDDFDPDKTSLGKHPVVPFYVAGESKNKSRVMPNDLFD